MAPRTLAVLAVLMAGCFVDQPGQPGGTETGTTAAAASTGPATGEPGSTGAQASGTGDGSTSGSTGPGDATTSTTADPTTTTTNPGDPTMGSICPPADGFPDIDPPECRACMAASCCAQVSDCAADPACAGAWSCTQTQPCISEWQNCPDYAAQQAKLGAISACGKAACASVCAFGPCAAEEAACEANPECQAVNACVQANCAAPCPPENPECTLQCWATCQTQHPQGADPWAALITCYGSKCP